MKIDEWQCDFKISVSLILRLVIIVLPLGLTSCSSGSSGSPTDDDPSGDRSEGFANGPLRGSILYDTRVLDLESGKITNLEFDNRFLITRPAISANADGSEFYTIDEQCRRDPRSSIYWIDCIVTYDRDGNRIGSIDTGIDLEDDAAPLISPDGLAFIVVSDLIDEDIARFVFASTDVFPSNAERQSEGLVATRPSWGPSNDAYYAKDWTIFRVISRLTPAALDQPIHEFTDHDNGRPVALSVSPDGTQMAVGRSTGSILVTTFGSVWIVDTDGASSREFITSADNRGVINPVWSPDGRWIIAEIDGVAGDGITNFGTAGALIAFDTSVDKHVVADGSEIDGVTQIRIRRCATDSYERCTTDVRLRPKSGELVRTWFE